MIPFDELDALITPAVELYRDLEEWIIRDIARRLRAQFFPSAAWQVNRLIEGGKLYRDILKRLATMQGLTEKELRQLFHQVGVINHNYNNAYFSRAGLKTFNKMSPASLQVLLAGFAKTHGEFVNLTRTTALAGQDIFIRAGDLVYAAVSTGTKDYNSAMKTVLKSVARKGIEYVKYSGKKDRVDVALRRAMLTGVAQTAGQLTIQDIKDAGTDLVEVSAHFGARNKGGLPENHQMWQGRVYSLSGKKDLYNDFYQWTGYGTGAGLLGWNCRHSFWPYIAGAPRVITRDDLAEMNQKRVIYNNDVMSFYKATQIQRGMEREIRALKREALALSEAGLDNWQEREKIKAMQAKLRDFVRQTGIQRQNVREQIIGQDAIVWRGARPKQVILPPSPLKPPVVKPLPIPKAINPIPKPSNTIPNPPATVPFTPLPELKVTGGLEAAVKAGLIDDDDPNRPRGISDTRKMRLPDGRHVIAKIQSRHGYEGETANEYLAYQIHEKLDLGIMPEAWYDPSTKTSYLLFVDNADVIRNLSPWQGQYIQCPEDIGRMQVFDILIRNTDRHEYNWLSKGGRAIAIDHNLSFANTGNRRLPEIIETVTDRFPGQLVKVAGNVRRLPVDKRIKHEIQRLINTGWFANFGGGYLNNEQQKQLEERARWLLKEWDRYFIT